MSTGSIRSRSVSFALSLTILTAWVFASQIALAQSVSQDQVESKVRSDVDSILSKMLEPNQYSVQVTASVDHVSERQVVEGEQTVVSSPSSRPIEIPPLPGFDPQPQLAPEQPPGQTRQVFRNVDKPILRSISVNLLLDQALDPKTAKTAEDSVRTYLGGVYPGLTHLNLQKAGLRGSPANSWLGGLSSAGWIWAAGLLAFGILSYFLFRIQRSLNSMSTASEIVPYRSLNGEGGFKRGGELESERGQLVGETARTADINRRELPALPAAREKTAFSGIPTNSQYADHRRLLLDAFLKNSSEFRQYFERLDAVARAELCSALGGPAFDTLMDSLKLNKEETSRVTPPTEEQLQFYLKNFSEYNEALRWQDQQFFGFLPHLTEEQLTSLVQSQNPSVGALILKFSRAEISATVLERLGETERSAIIDQFERTREMSPDEMSEIEQSVRSAVRTLPNFIVGSFSQEIDYWTRLLAAAPDPQKLLRSIERIRPDLYERLAKFRFQLEDLPSLPTALVRKVMDDFENDDLARALSQQSDSIVRYALNELSPARQKLLESQILSYQNSANAEVRRSIDTLTRRFREVLL